MTRFYHTVMEPTTTNSDPSNPGPTQLIVPSTVQTRAQQAPKSSNSPPTSDNANPSTSATAPTLRMSVGVGGNTKLTINDVERERGKPLTKYERNMMIFNWLHTLDEAASEEVSAQ